MKVKVGDNVRILAGKDKGKDGRIIKTLKKDNKVVVEGINVIKKHVKPNRMNEVGSIVEVEEQITDSLMKKFNYSSKMEVPRLEKIVINMGVGEGAADSKFIEAALKDLELIAGQKPVVTKARKSIAGFKIREGQTIGAKVTLRGENMYNFMEKLIKIALPRVRDFRGVSKTAFDGKGNYTLGVKEQIIFPEIEYDQILKLRGMDIVFVTTAKTNEEAFELLSGFGMPFRK